jgi:hypothetical protein
VSLPTDAKARKDVPIATGCLDYFPDALAAVAGLSKKGNDQHNPGQALHWAREKSGDEADAMMRHFVERGTVDTDGELHSTKVAWRALANLQKEIEYARCTNDDERRAWIAKNSGVIPKGGVVPAAVYKLPPNPYRNAIPLSLAEEREIERVVHQPAAYVPRNDKVNLPLELEPCSPAYRR